MKPSIYSSKPHTQGQKLGQVLEQLKNQVTLGGSHGFVTDGIARAAVSMESMNSVVEGQFHSAIDNLRNTIENIQGLVFPKAEAGKPALESLTEAQRSAAIVGGVISGSPLAFLSRQQSFPQSTDANVFVGAASGEERMKMALEAYDEKDNRNAAIYTIAYNMQAARQDEFGEAFFPTIVVTPDQVGFKISIDLVTIIDDARRQITGALDNLNRKNIIYAVRDASILKNDLTQLVPVYRAGNTANIANFVPVASLPTRTVTIGGEAITTSALAFGKNFSLLGLSQSDSLIAIGLQDTTDAVDTAVSLSALYLEVAGVVSSVATKEIIRLETLGLPKATFTGAVQGAARDMTLSFSTESLRIGATTTQASGTASVLLAPLVSASYSVRLSVNVSGTVNLQTSATNVMAGDVTVISITNSAGVKYAPTDGAVSAIAALFTGAKFLGYDLDARRTNSNRRQRGQLLDTITYNQTYAVPLLSPITVPRPLGLGDQTDPTDLAALITATRIRTSNAAVTELLRSAAILKQIVNENDNAFDQVEVLGTGRHLVTPVYVEDTIDFETAIDSLTSHQRADDIMAVLVNKIRDVAYHAYRDSGYKAAADALNGGNAPVPTVIIGTDPVLARYINVTGDLRTLGGEFNVRLVSTLDGRVKDKIFVAFGDFKGSEGAPNPLHFGNMGWKPEMTLVLPLHRNGANSKELVVQPSFLHVTNCPILGVLTVTNLPEVVASKVAIWNDVQ
jgi:hypothetical protein